MIDCCPFLHSYVLSFCCLLLSLGSIDEKEMVEIVVNMCELEGVARETAVARAQTIFRLLDSNNDGEEGEL